MAAAGCRALLIAPALLLAACTSVAPDGRSFGGTWRVAAVNSQPTPATGDYRIEFTGDRIGGRFGCNSFGGTYAVAGEAMTFGDIASTLMGCPEPAASFETAGFKVLSEPARWTWVAGLRLTLSNSQGSIALERRP